MGTYLVASLGFNLLLPSALLTTRSITTSKGTIILVTNNGIASVAHSTVAKHNMAKQRFASSPSTIGKVNSSPKTSKAATNDTPFEVIENLPSGVGTANNGSSFVSTVPPRALTCPSLSPRLSRPIICRHTVSRSQTIYAQDHLSLHKVRQVQNILCDVPVLAGES